MLLNLISSFSISWYVFLYTQPISMQYKMFYAKRNLKKCDDPRNAESRILWHIKSQNIHKILLIIFQEIHFKQCYDVIILILCLKAYTWQPDIRNLFHISV